MRRVFISALKFALTGYLVGWLLAFVALVSDVSLLPQYAVWSWTGGGERATFVQISGLASAVFGALAGGSPRSRDDRGRTSEERAKGARRERSAASMRSCRSRR